MEYNTRDIDLIELYLEGKLSGEDLLNFEREREENPELQRRVDEMAVIIDCVKSSGRESLLEELRELESGLPEVELEEGLSRKDNIIRLGKTKIRKLYWRTSQYVALAASLAGIFFGLARPQYQFMQNLDEYRKYQTPLENLHLASYRGEASRQITFNEAAEAFKQEKFGKTIRLIKGSEEKSEAEWMMLGNSYFQKKRYKKAAECFRLDKFSLDSELLDDAKFSLALSLIAIGEGGEADLILKELVEGNNNSSLNAREILNRNKRRKNK